MKLLKAMESVVRGLLVCLIRGYQMFVSPLKPRCCRFEPTCSHYAIQALRTHGLIGGLWLSLRRILRCHPLYHGPTYDPVPPAK